MKNGKTPDPNVIHPIPGYENEIYVKPTVKNPNIMVGDFTYIADSDFERHVTHLYDWNGDKLIIGRFCQIAAGVEFVMNGANHQMNAVSTFPFYTLEGWDMDPPAAADLPRKGDTVIGHRRRRDHRGQQRGGQRRGAVHDRCRKSGKAPAQALRRRADRAAAALPLVGPER